MKISRVTKKLKLGVVVRSPEPYHDAMVNSVEEFLKSFQPGGWKKEVREKQIKLDPDQHYGPAQVAAIINRSYDTALRLMKKLGASDLGTPTRRYKRGKSMYVVSGRKLRDYLQSKT